MNGQILPNVLKINDLRDQTHGRTERLPGKNVFIKAVPVVPISNTNGSKLSASETVELERFEQIIEASLQTFVEVGQALQQIKCKRLYRNHFQTFEEYCHSRWDISRFYAYRLIGASEVVERLLTIGNTPLPKNESQTRPLIRVAPNYVGKVWKKALELAGGDEVRRKHVEQACSQVLNDRPKGKKAGNKGQTPENCYGMSIVCGLIKELNANVHAGNTDHALLLLEKLRINLERLQTSSGDAAKTALADGEHP